MHVRFTVHRSSFRGVTLLGRRNLATACTSPGRCKFDLNTTQTLILASTEKHAADVFLLMNTYQSFAVLVMHKCHAG